ncbi:Hsp70 family protein [Parabacteroides sp.]
MEKDIFGIDLGTTNSCIAQIDDYGKAVVKPNSEGLLTTPSVVSYEPGNNRPFVGEIAKEALISDPTRTVAFIKRELGNDNFQSTCEVKESPVKVSAYILKKLVNEVNESNGSSIKDVVITCPAYFGTREREQTKQAGIVAGLNVLSIINEPTAAAIAYGIDENCNKTVLVYDLGGGTFDVSIIQIKNGEIEVIATGGDHRLGGVDWDTMLAKYMAKEIGIQIDFDAQRYDKEYLSTKNLLLINAEKAKKALTQRTSVNVSIPYNGQTHRLEISLTLFNQLTSVLLNQTIDKMEEVIDLAKDKGINKIDTVILVGGSTRMKQVQERVEKELSCKADIKDPDMAVAKGAAIFASRIKEERRNGPHLGGSVGGIKDTSANSYGVGCYAKDGTDIVQNLILAQSPVAITRSGDFCVWRDGQNTITFPIYEGTSTERNIDPLDATLLETFVLDLKKGYPKDTPIDVSMERTTEGILKLHASIDGNTLNAELKLKGVLTEEELLKEERNMRNIKL